MYLNILLYLFEHLGVLAPVLVRLVLDIYPGHDKKKNYIHMSYNVYDK